MTMDPRTRRAVGTVLGSAVGDALGAPFEFGPEGAFSARFPSPGADGEMCGGGGWDPGEATDDTQMAVLVGESLLECDGLELPDVFRRFQRWAAAEPKDIGLQTEAVLSGGDPWDLAAALHFQTSGRAAGNGALMRAGTSAVYFAGDGTEATMEAGRRIAALTHGDRAAWEGTALFHELVRVALAGGDPLEALPGALDLVHPDHRARYSTVLATDWHPDKATAGGSGGVPQKTQQRSRVAVSRFGRVGLAEHMLVRGRRAGRGRSGRGHRHRGGRHGRARGGRVRRGGHTGAVGRTAARTAAGVRRADATGGGTGGAGRAVVPGYAGTRGGGSSAGKAEGSGGGSAALAADMNQFSRRGKRPSRTLDGFVRVCPYGCRG